MVYDFTTGTWKVATEQTKIHDSALDRNRSIVDPGSLQNVNYYTTDAAGNRVHVTGKTWRSNGKPHSQITRKIVHRDSQGNQWTEEVQNLKATNPNSQPQSPNQPQFNQPQFPGNFQTR